MEFILSQHAADTIHEREIRLEWVRATLDCPVRILPHTDDPDLSHALREIPEFGYRVLRVVYNHTRQPAIVVTAYFDRTMKGKL